MGSRWKASVFFPLNLDDDFAKIEISCTRLSL